MQNFHRFIQNSDGWNVITSEQQFANPYVEVYRATVTSPTRPEPFTWTVVHRKGAVVVAPMTADGKFLLVRQERVPIRATIWEFPAGQIDDTSDPDAIRATGLRELEEEAGYALVPGGELIALGHYFPSCGFTDEHSHLLLARPVALAAGGAKPEASESITECRAFSVQEIRTMIASGEICDANTLVGANAPDSGNTGSR
jgi:ADP-ribose pyrophosphatase